MWFRRDASAPAALPAPTDHAACETISTNLRIQIEDQREEIQRLTLRISELEQASAKERMELIDRLLLVAAPGAARMMVANQQMAGMGTGAIDPAYSNSNSNTSESRAELARLRIDREKAEKAARDKREGRENVRPIVDPESMSYGVGHMRRLSEIRRSSPRAIKQVQAEIARQAEADVATGEPIPLPEPPEPAPV